MSDSPHPLTKRAPHLVAALALLAALAGCETSEEIFTRGRIENRCNASIPVCGYIAACVLTQEQYLRAQFPGGARLIVRTEIDQAQLVTRFMLLDERFPGTEIFVRAYSTGCGDYNEGHAEDVDLFELAGDDGIIEYGLNVTGLGDHMVEIFSDMSAEFLFRVDVED
jgi:hypothetical protein